MSSLSNRPTGSSKNIKEDVIKVAEALLEPLLKLCESIDAHDDATGMQLSCLLAVLRLIEVHHWNDYLGRLGKRLVGFLKLTYGVCFTLIKRMYFNRDWVTMVMIQNDVRISALSPFFLLAPRPPFKGRHLSYSCRHSRIIGCERLPLLLTLSMPNPFRPSSRPSRPSPRL